MAYHFARNSSERTEKPDFCYYLLIRLCCACCYPFNRITLSLDLISWVISHFLRTLCHMMPFCTGGLREGFFPMSNLCLDRFLLGLHSLDINLLTMDFALLLFQLSVLTLQPCAIFFQPLP